MSFSLFRMLSNLRFKESSAPVHIDGAEDGKHMLHCPVYVQLQGFRVEVWAADYDYNSKEIVLKLKGDRS